MRPSRTTDTIFCNDMNTGLLSVRYARALFEAAKRHNGEEHVYQDMQRMAQCYIEVPRLRNETANPLLQKKTKRNLMTSAIGNDKAHPLSLAFIDMVLKEGREDIMQFMANAYITIYRKDKHITPARLITSTPLTTLQKSRIEELVRKRMAEGSVELEAVVDKHIIGGFVLDFDNKRLDASLRTELKELRKLLEQK